ncbi:MAG: hypothetical protein ACLQVM_09965 [Terriglobia bacterium]
MWRIIRLEAVVAATCPKATFHVSGCVTAKLAGKTAAQENQYERTPVMPAR